MNKLSAVHAIEVTDLLSPTNQPMADISDASPKKSQRDGSCVFPRPATRLGKKTVRIATASKY